MRSWTAGRVGHVEIARPERRNALEPETIRSLRAAVRALAHETEIRCLVLSGAGASFSAGGDIAALRRQSPSETLAHNRAVLEAAAELERLPIPSVAALHGHALGGGLELALGASLRIASDDARLGFPEVGLGLIPGGGGTSRLPHIAGRGGALLLLLTGEPVGAAEALRMGLVDQIVPAGELMPAAVRLAERIAANGPLAVRAIRDLVRAQDERLLAAAIADAERRLEDVLASDDLREGLAAFSERRAPAFTGC
ncbi:enoyl-CoA hydratase/isomerase family protein [Capillimicrobium parvum]|uniref:enoyl-CoA hydratase/isomerase family protein n=1 Tax=Capillimicrobium parvum TaxID=2884022 RepID=UPI00216ABBBD|nr:enoyl-CoA hydratase/isomerase family protein [Capillimicrobium parvum]